MIYFMNVSFFFYSSCILYKGRFYNYVLFLFSQVNGISVENRTVHEVEKLLDSCDAVMLNVVRLTSPMSSGLPSSASPTVSSYKSGHETSSSKSSLTHLLSPHELTSSEGEGRCDRTKHGNQKDKSQYEDFSSEWPITATSAQQYTNERNHNSNGVLSRSDNPWEERRDTGSVRRRTDIPMQSQNPNRASYGGSPHYQGQSLQDSSFVGSPSRLSVKEANRRSFHQSQGSGDSVRENKHAASPENRHDQNQRSNQCLVIKNEGHDMSRNSEGPPDYIDPPPAHTRQQGSPMTEQRRHKSSRSEINRTWPKSRKPPDIYRSSRDPSGRSKPRKKSKRRTAIPLMTSPSYESMSADEENDDESDMVPPIPPSRTSSFKASLRHQQPVAGTSPTSTPGQELISKLPVATHVSVPSPERIAKSESSSRGDSRSCASPLGADNSLYAMHYAATSLPDTNVDFAGSPNSVAFRPISTPSIPEQAKSNNSAIQNNPQRPNQLEVARYYSPQQNSYSRRTPSPSTTTQYYERRYGGYVSRSSSESMPGLLTVEPSNATLVRLRNHVPYFTVRSQPLADPKQSAMPGFPRTRPGGPRASIHSLSSEDDPSRAPSRNSLPEHNLRLSLPAPDTHHSLEFPADGMYTPTMEGYHRTPHGYDPTGPNRFNSLPVKRMRIPGSRASPSSGGQSNSSLDKGKGKYPYFFALL